MQDKSFSKQLNHWLDSDEEKTIGGLIDHFAQKSFAILFLLLLAIPALPMPTGGITHIFEIIAMLISLELITGSQRIWLPKILRKLKLPSRLLKSTLPTLIKVIKKTEKYSRPRLGGLLKNTVVIRIIGLLIFMLSLVAFLAPPFTGLDTLPALGVVFISLSMILEDFVISVLGIIIGVAGVGLVIGIGKVILSLF